MNREKRSTTTSADRTPPAPPAKKRKSGKDDISDTGSDTTVNKGTPVILPSMSADDLSADGLSADNLSADTLSADKISADEEQTSSTTMVPSEPICCLYTFGVNIAGQIGHNPGAVEQMEFPSLCEALHLSDQRIKAIAAGGMHSLVLTDKGHVITFGCNDEGALGLDVQEIPDEECAKPSTVSLPGKAISISAGNSHSAALLEDGSVHCWGTFRDGNGHYGLLPDDNEASRKHFSPVKLRLNTRIRSIASGNDHMALLSEQGQILTFGADSEALGRPRMITRQNSGKTINLTPQSIHEFRKFKAVWCGSSSTFCLEDNAAGTVWVFGMNSQLQLGIPSTGENMVVAPIPSPAITRLHFTKIAVGEFHCLGLTPQGNVYSWGKPHEGQLGLGNNTPAGPISIPTYIETLNDRVVSIACGNSVSYAVTEGSELYSWGFGENWQLGKADDEDSKSPQPVLSKIRGEPARKVQAVSSGGQHTLLVGEYGLGMDIETAVEPEPMDTSC